MTMVRSKSPLFDLGLKMGRFRNGLKSTWLTYIGVIRILTYCKFIRLGSHPPSTADLHELLGRLFFLGPRWWFLFDFFIFTPTWGRFPF